jgi:hypothetical protein
VQEKIVDPWENVIDDEDIGIYNSRRNRKEVVRISIV